MEKRLLDDSRDLRIIRQFDTCEIDHISARFGDGGGTFDGLVRVLQANGGATVSPRGKPESLDAFLQEVRAQGGR